MCLEGEARMPELSSRGASTNTAGRTRGGETGGNFRKVYPVVSPTTSASPSQHIHSSPYKPLWKVLTIGQKGTDNEPIIERIEHSWGI